jgi:predicted nucleic acid-binding Zn ribbon protein
MPDCPTCGAALPSEARFCPACGREVPEESRGGLPRPGILDAAAAVLALLAVVLLVLTLWTWALVCILAAAVLVLARSWVADGRWRPAVHGARARFSVTREHWAARSREQVEVFRARRELADLESERGRLLRDLGTAVYAGDETGTEAARAALDAVGAKVEAKEGEIATLRQETQERVERARAEVRPTQVLSVPEPAQVPEPWPPPDEAELPEPDPQPSEPEPGESDQQQRAS